MDIKKHEWPVITDAMVRRVLHCLRNEHLSEYEEEGGPLREFEKDFSWYHGVRFALLESSGTSALFSAYHALGIRPGDTVFVPAFTFTATASPLLFLGAEIVLVDCDEQANMDPWDLEKKLRKYKAKAVVVTHNGGIPANLERILALRKDYGFSLVEDCARAPGSEFKGKKVGGFGDIGCFSFQEKKAVFWWEWGMVITNDRVLYEKMILVGHYFRSKSPLHIQNEELRTFSETGFGMNFSIHPLSVAIAHESFLDLDKTVLAREASGNSLKNQLARAGVRGIIPMEVPEFCTRAGYYHYVFRYDPLAFPWINRASYVEGLRRMSVDARISDNKPLHRFPLFQEAGIRHFWMPGARVIAEGLVKSEAFFDSMVTLPPITDASILEEYVRNIRHYETIIDTNSQNRVSSRRKPSGPIWHGASF